jgi:hypothetical protein
MTLIDVEWSLTVGDSPTSHRQTTLLPPWAEVASNAETVAEACASAYFTRAEWVEWFGTEDDEAGVIIDIHKPAAVAGRYSVALGRTVTAHAIKEKG